MLFQSKTGCRLFCAKSVASTREKFRRGRREFILATSRETSCGRCKKHSWKCVDCWSSCSGSACIPLLKRPVSLAVQAVYTSLEWSSFLAFWIERERLLQASYTGVSEQLLAAPGTQSEKWGPLQSGSSIAQVPTETKEKDGILLSGFPSCFSTANSVAVMFWW